MSFRDERQEGSASYDDGIKEAKNIYIKHGRAKSETVLVRAVSEREEPEVRTETFKRN